MDTKTKKTKTFADILEFDKQIVKEEESKYIYTCPPLYPFGIEFKTYGDEIWIQEWIKDNGKWNPYGGISKKVNVDAAVSDEWKGFELRIMKYGDC